MNALFFKVRAHLFALGIASLSGCCTLGDPSCAVPRELYETECGRELLYCPDASCEGLNQSHWYCDPLGWDPACPPALLCGPEYSTQPAVASAVFALPNYRQSKKETYR